MCFNRSKTKRKSTATPSPAKSTDICVKTEEKSVATTSSAASTDTYDIVRGDGIDFILTAFRGSCMGIKTSLSLKIKGAKEFDNDHPKSLEMHEVDMAYIKHGSNPYCVVDIEGFCRAWIPEDEKILPHRFKAHYDMHRCTGTISFYG